MSKLEDELNQKLKEQENERLKLVELQSKLGPIMLIVAAVIIAGLGLIGLRGPSFFIPAAVTAILCIILYSTSIYSPFKKLADNSRAALLQHFMASYHPDIPYEYYRRARLGNRILRSVKLINYDTIKEEDVIEGKMDNAHFYLSEITLKTESDKSSTVVFDGMLFKLKIPGRNFPRTDIINRVNYGSDWMNKFVYEGIGKIFSGRLNYTTDESGKFMYRTKNEDTFREELSQLLPFIEFLSSKKSAVRIRAEGDEIVMMLADEVNFLDEPAFKLKRSFYNKKFNNNMGKQLNSLLYILETFIKNTDSSEIKERLELKELELMKDMQSNYREGEA